MGPQPIPSDLNLCLEALKASDEDIDVCHADRDKWKKIAGQALSQRDSAIQKASTEASADFLGIPPLGWGVIGLIAGGVGGYLAFHR